MCGIVGYVGGRQAYPILIKGLMRLEYRGYDSAGVALINDSSELTVYKTRGKVKDLENLTAGKDVSGSTGIAHTQAEVALLSHLQGDGVAHRVVVTAFMHILVRAVGHAERLRGEPPAIDELRASFVHLGKHHRIFQFFLVAHQRPLLLGTHAP